MLYEIISLLIAFPLGYWVSYLARDELIVGRKWFLLIMGVSVIASIVFFILKDDVIGFSALFILVFTGISYQRSFDKKLTENPIE